VLLCCATYQTHELCGMSHMADVQRGHSCAVLLCRREVEAMMQERAARTRKGDLKASIASGRALQEERQQRGEWGEGQLAGGPAY
jgi:hypothetical protein